MGNMSSIYTTDGSRTIGWTSGRESTEIDSDLKIGGNENQKQQLAEMNYFRV